MEDAERMEDERGGEGRDATKPKHRGRGLEDELRTRIEDLKRLKAQRLKETSLRQLRELGKTARTRTVGSCNKPIMIGTNRSWDREEWSRAGASGRRTE